MHILVVDDDLYIREMLGELLRDEGFTVATARHGGEALDYLRAAARPPCVILLDLMMPQMNGWEFRAAQREDAALARIPVVTMSAHADLLRPAATLDVAAHLAKPISLPDLFATLERCCGTPET